MEPQEQSNGALIGSVIIIIILIIGGIFFFKNVKRNTVPTNTETPTLNGNSTTSLEADANNIDLNNLDQ